jgi:hypothetical protein
VLESFSTLVCRRDSAQLALCVARQIRAFGQVLAQQAMRVLIRAVLTGAMQIGEEHRMLSRSARRVCWSFLGNPWQALVASVPSFRAKEDQARRPLHQGANSQAMASTLRRSPSPWPGPVRVATSSGRAVSGVLWGIWPRRSVPRDRGLRAWRAGCHGPAVRCAGPLR